jgi:hypothetical protein
MEKNLPGRWVRELLAAVTVCDRSGTVIEMNEVSAAFYAADGGFGLIGKNIRDCHPPEARMMIDSMLANGSRHLYMTEKNGVRTMICELPWYEKGTFSGLVELSIVLPDTVPCYRRD